MKKILSSLLLSVFICTSAFADTVIITKTKILESTPTITAGAYTSGDHVGGAISLSGAVKDSVGTGIISSVTLIDKAAQGVDYDVVFYDGSYTAVADNAVADPTDTDLLNIICVVHVTDHIAFSDNGISQAQNVNCPFDLSAPLSTLYAELIVKGAPTYASVSDLMLRVGILQD